MSIRPMGAVSPGAAMLALLAAAPAAAMPSTIGLDCSGQEILSSASQPDRVSSYAIRLQIDLPRRVYCYGACAKAQTYAIADARSVPVKLADVDTPQPSRHMTLDPDALSLVDDQRIGLGLAGLQVRRHATAQCKRIPFERPPAP